jgi:FKBP-type peptidyl-prolyl cis-trans isomerase
MKNFQKAIAVIALSGMCLAATAPSDTDVAAKKSKKHAKTEAAAPACAACEDIKQLKQQISAQQAEIDQLKNVQPQAAVTDAAAAAAAAAAQKQAAAAAAAAAEADAKAGAAQSDVAGLKTEVTTTSQEVQVEKKKIDYLEHPASIAYKGIRFTPGGFFDLSAIYRQHATNSGPATQFNAIPLENNLLGVGGLSEFSMTARGTRLALRADADAGSTKLAGYFEGDFYANPIATPNQTTSYGMRIRQGWGRAKFADGWSITGGQMWNGITMSRKAADADAPWIPNTIDTNYVVGFDWGRQAELRLAKTFGKSATFALSLVDPSYLGGSITTTSIAGLAVAGSGNLGNTFITCNNEVPVTCTTATDAYSTNLAPDVIVKLAFDSKLGHFEIKGLQRFFRDRVVGSAPVAATATTPAVAGVPSTNNTALGGGIGGGAIIPIIAKKVDFVAQGMWGKGISRYEDAQQVDFVVRSADPAGFTPGDKNLQAVKSVSAIFGFETHPTKKTEFDVWGGDEYYYRTPYFLPSTTVAGRVTGEGYGNPYGAGGANTRNLLEGTAVLWYDVYKGSFGTLRYGAQYEYIERLTWSGNGEGTNAVAKVATNPKGIDNVGMLSMRYIIP